MNCLPVISLRNSVYSSSNSLFFTYVPKKKKSLYCYNVSLFNKAGSINIKVCSLACNNSFSVILYNLIRWLKTSCLKTTNTICLYINSLIPKSVVTFDSGSFFLPKIPLCGYGFKKSNLVLSFFAIMMEQADHKLVITANGLLFCCYN